MTDPDNRIAVLVHEVRSPVAALVAIAEAVGEATGEQREELVRLGLVACSAIERLVTDITVASVRATLVDVGALVGDAARARALVGDVVNVEVDDTLSPVRGDSVRLRQVLDNLLANASVHAVGAGAIELSACDVPGGVKVSVGDRGPGIPADELDLIFEPGVRLDDARRGTGLGLAITRAIVDAHGGAMTVESSPGRGTTFTMTLPAAGDRHPDT